MRKLVVLIVGALLLAGCGTAVVGSSTDLFDVFAFQEYCSQGNQGDGA